MNLSPLQLAVGGAVVLLFGYAIFSKPTPRALTPATPFPPVPKPVPEPAREPAKDPTTKPLILGDQAVLGDEVMISFATAFLAGGAIAGLPIQPPPSSRLLVLVTGGDTERLVGQITGFLMPDPDLPTRDVRTGYRVAGQPFVFPRKTILALKHNGKLVT